jgi:tRNA (Thr-GGU) A37 N-methylase
MYGDTEPVKIYPIGIVKSTLKKTSTWIIPAGDQLISRIELISTQKPFLYKLDEEEFITVVYYLHKAGPVKTIFKRGLGGKKVGVFASRTPARLSRIAIQDVRLVKIEKTTLYVKGLDAINGSPVLDIKLKYSAVPEE